MVHTLRLLWLGLRDRRGIAPVELAFIAPALMVVTIGLVDLGRAMLINSTLKHAAIAGARFASIRGADAPTPASEADVVDFARSQAAGLPPNDISVTVTWLPNNNAGSTVTVDLSMAFELLSIGFLPIVTPMQLTGASSLVIH